MISPKYKNIYTKFIECYKDIHVNPWHEISEEQLHQLYNYLVSSFDIDNEPNFKYFMDYIIKRLSGTEDAHTMYESISLLPMNFRIFENEVLVNYPEDIKYGKVLAINGINIETILKELDEITTYGTMGRRRYEIEKALFNRQILFGLPSLRASSELVFEIETLNKETLLKRIARHKSYDTELFEKNIVS